MIVTTGLSPWLILRIAIGLLTLLAVARSVFNAYARGRRGRGIISKAPGFAFNLLVIAATLHMLAMMTIGAQMLIYVMDHAPRTQHLFVGGLLVATMVLSLPLIFALFGKAVYRDRAKSSS